MARVAVRPQLTKLRLLIFGFTQKFRLSQYIDGAGWIPPKGYDPKQRSWYIEALKGAGQMILSAPYLDAQTGKIVISFSQLLSDGESVLALDIVLDEVQNITEHMTMGGMGYGFITDSSGLVVAHVDLEEAGKDYSKQRHCVIRSVMKRG